MTEYRIRNRTKKVHAGLGLSRNSASRRVMAYKMVYFPVLLRRVYKRQTPWTKAGNFFRWKNYSTAA